MNQHIGILGGTGFVGQVLCNQLSSLGYRVTVLTRNREKNKANLILLPNLNLIEVNVYDKSALSKSLSSCDVVINLVGILNEGASSNAKFERVHVTLTQSLIEVCQSQRISKIFHMSALNAGALDSSTYLKTKGSAEKLLKNADEITATCLRPSVIFGARDKFFNRFARLLKLSPLVFPLACYKTKFAPVYVHDLVTFLIYCLENPKYQGQTYNICGPKTYTLFELVHYTAKVLGLRRYILPLNDKIAYMQAVLFGFIPSKPFSVDNYRSAQKDSICSGSHALADFKMDPKSIEQIVPRYLLDKDAPLATYADLRRAYQDD